MNDFFLKMTDEELVKLGYLVIERRFNSTSYFPTQKYKDAMANPYPNGVPFVCETSEGRFLVSGENAKLLGPGENPELTIIHEAVLEEAPERLSGSF